jgi:hypothetical protein
MRSVRPSHARSVQSWSQNQLRSATIIPVAPGAHQRPRGPRHGAAASGQIAKAAQAIVALATLGRTLHRRRDDVRAYFTHRASNGPTEAIDGRLEALRRNALGFPNLINYGIRSLLQCGNLAL